MLARDWQLAGQNRAKCAPLHAGLLRPFARRAHPNSLCVYQAPLDTVTTPVAGSMEKCRARSWW